MKNCVYRFLDRDDNIIYIGKAKDLKSRLYSHNHLPKECYDEVYKIEFTEFNTEDDMDLAERYYIPKYKPKYNTAMNHRTISFDIYELDNAIWKEKSKEYKNEKEIKVSKKEKRKMYLENLKKAYNEKESFKLDKLKIDMNKRIIISSTGEVFENISEFIGFTKTFYSPELLIEACRSNIHLSIKHPIFYDVYCIPKFLDDYDTFSSEQKKIIESRQEVNTRKIICLTTGEVFVNVHQAQDKYNLKNVWNCCRGLSNYCGVSNDIPLVWKWHDSYMKMDEYEVNNLVNKAYLIFNKRNKAS